MGWSIIWDFPSNGFIPLTSTSALSYCFALSGTFVGSLYVLCPSRVRHLQRDDDRQIKWRTFATSVVCIGGMITSSCVFLYERGTVIIPAFVDWERDSYATLGLLTHTALLYAGPLFQMALEVYTALQKDKAFSPKDYLKTLYLAYIRPLFKSVFAPVSPSQRWAVLRNLVIAPLAEEIVFRGCMVPVLYATGMRPRTVVTFAPLFFGMAHVHHAVVSYMKHQSEVRVIAIRSSFQLLYTSLFGSYSSFALLRTGSVFAVAASHSFCNGMGLPTLSFANSRSHLHRFRRSLWAVHLLGIVLFAYGFRSEILIPKSGLLP